MFVYGVGVSREGAQLLVGLLLRYDGEGSGEAVAVLMQGLHDSLERDPNDHGRLSPLVPLSPRMRAAIHAVLEDGAPDELVELREKLVREQANG